MAGQQWFCIQRPEDDGERGAVLYILAMFLVIFIAVAALAVDLASIGARGQDLQNTSDAAALAAVVEYQEQLLATGNAATATAAAEAVALEIAAQNRINPDADNITVEVTVVDDPNTPTPPQVVVAITDADPDSFLPSGDLLGGVVRGGGESTVRRVATAEFLACEGECAVIIPIPEPFQAPAAGAGDGYKPILIGTKVYALNHNSTGQAIVCVDRVTQLPCWLDANGNLEVSRNAYAPSVSFTGRSPEMPQTGVVGTRIYWAAADPAYGLRLFCWDTATDAACLTAHTLDSTLLRGNRALTPLTNVKDENRGGGTIAVDGKIFVFSDNHRIHCFDPAFGGVCAGYLNGGNPTALDVFPPSSPDDGNHGSSIDRIVDEGTGFIYSILHIPNAMPIVDCASPLGDPAGKRAVVINEATGRFLTAGAGGNVVATGIGGEAAAWWDIENAGADTLSLQSADSGEYLDADPFFVTTSAVLDDSGEWNSLIDGDAYFIDSEFFGGGLFDDAGNSGQIIEEDPPTSPNARWNFYPWQCGDPAAFVPAGPVSPDWFQSGSWLHCYDTGVVSGLPQPCPGFTVNGTAHEPPGTPSPIHLDASRFSGRLWFHHTSGSAAIQGVCSSGYDEAFTPSEIEVTCVTLTGDYSASMTNSMVPVQNTIQNWTGTDPGAWGDPHWNEATNRLFYPTEHNTAQIVCFDFDSGPCGSFTGVLPPNPKGDVGTEDYGFVSEGDCIFAFGHHSFFWSFRASDTEEECDPQPLPTTIFRCPCGDGALYRWGELDFRQVDLSPFDAFGVRVLFDEGPGSAPIFPSDGSFVSLKPGNADRLIPLDDLDIPPDTQSISVEIFIQGTTGVDLTNLGEFEVRFTQRPRLVD